MQKAALPAIYVGNLNTVTGIYWEYVHKKNAGNRNTGMQVFPIVLVV